jgi:hypothetical protein
MNQVAWYRMVLRIGLSALAFALWSCNSSDQQPANSPLTYEAGLGGKPLGDAPTSKPL